MAGDEGCGGMAGIGKVVEPDAEAGPGSAEGIEAGMSAILCNSGAVGLGTKIVFRTSRRPRSVDERLGGAAC